MPVYQSPVGKILFIHVPKTGGTSIEVHLGAHYPFDLRGNSADPTVPCKSQHYHGEVLARLLATTPIAYSFMIVRHPVERIISEFKFQSRKPSRFYRRFFFSAWLRRNLRHAVLNRYLRDNHFRPQVEFEAFSPEVFRFEEGLTICFEKLEAVTGLPRPAREIHVWKSRDETVSVTKEDLDIIHDFYRADFERYGYTL